MAKRRTPTVGFLHPRDFGGSTAIVCVTAPIEATSGAVARHERWVVDADVYGKKAANGLLAFQYAKHPCSIVLLRNAPDYLAELSAELAATIGAFEYEKVSGWEQLRIYADGRCVETYAYGYDYTDESGDDPIPEATDDGKPFDHRVARDGTMHHFRSERRMVDASLITDDAAMLDATATFYGLVFPGWKGMPTETDGKIGGLTKSAFARVDAIRRPVAAELASTDGGLRESIEQLDVTKVRAALATKPDLKRVVGLRCTPIQLVVSRWKAKPMAAAEIAVMLASRGADVHSKGDADVAEPPLFMPFNETHDEGAAISILDALLLAKADINSRGGRAYSRDKTLLHLAVRNGDLATVRFLIGRGADPTLTNGAGHTPRAAAEESIAMYLDEDWPGADTWVPKLQAIAECLRRAELPEAD